MDEAISQPSVRGSIFGGPTRLPLLSRASASLEILSRAHPLLCIKGSRELHPGGSKVVKLLLQAGQPDGLSGVMEFSQAMRSR